ncbi:MAG: dephospho-CoA kinase [Spirochaetota bacterium]
MKIGVTGIYASGKGTVCSMFEELGAKVIDTDILAREVVEPGTQGLEAYVKEFGKEILNADGSLNRRVLANIVFKDPSKVKLINETTHPLILQKMLEIISAAPDKIYMVNTPLLYETDFHKYMDYNIAVFANNDQVIKRGVGRDNITETEIKDRLNNQISLNEKVKLADYVIDNSNTIENTKRQVLEIWKTLQQKIRKA